MKVPVRDRKVMAEEEGRLLQRLKGLQELENSIDTETDEVELRQATYMMAKEKWFVQASPFLRDLPEDEHCWCKHQAIMQPFLEIFSNYREDLDSSSAVIYLWKRISRELRRCRTCIELHHAAQSFFLAEYEENVVLPILKIIQSLDEERVATHLKDLAQEVKQGSLHLENDLTEFICVIFEVLTFPSLLEDAEVNDFFKPIIQYMSATHDLSLQTGQRYPGLYALFVHSEQSVRSMANELAKPLGKFRDGADLETIQPIIRIWINALEYNEFDTEGLISGRQRLKGKKTDLVDSGVGAASAHESGRRRTAHKQEAVWIGLQTLLSLLEPLAFEEGVLDRYPQFVSMILNNVSRATSVFWYPLRCLRLLLEILGCKLWLCSTFSAGLMLNTLISQCFHSREEKLHASVFELFQPFLQSLEGLQDEEYERQRRRLLYFLLHQVPASSNFSQIMQKKASQVAFMIVGRAYSLEPPAPPIDCAHFWGPCLVTALKDSSLHASLRQPAIDLMQTILVSDAAALGRLSAKPECPQLPWSCFLWDSSHFEDEDTDLAVESRLSNEDKYWISFQKLTDTIGEEVKDWFCIPLLWMEGLQRLLPVEVPPSFSKTVLWAASRLCLFNEDFKEEEGDLLVLHDGIAFSETVGFALRWSKPTGIDDGKDGNPCLNAVNAKLYQKELTGALKRCAEVYCSQVFKTRLFERWAWEPRISEPIVLLLLDTNLGNFAREILRHFAKEIQWGSEELKLLCITRTSVVAASRGFRFAARLLLAFSFPNCFPGLQAIFLQSLKLFKIDQHVSGTLDSVQRTSASVHVHDGGSFKEPHFMKKSLGAVNIRPGGNGDKPRKMMLKLLAIHIWPLVLKCLITGKQYANNASQQIIFIRVMELLPLVCKNLPRAAKRQFFGQNPVDNIGGTANTSSTNALEWFQHFVGWGEISDKSIHRWWKLALGSLISGFMDRDLPLSEDLLKIVDELRASGTSIDADYRQRLLILHVSAPSLMQQRSPVKELQWDDDVGLLPSDRVQSKSSQDLDRPLAVDESAIGVLEEERRSNEMGLSNDRAKGLSVIGAELSSGDGLLYSGQAKSESADMGSRTSAPDIHDKTSLDDRGTQDSTFKRPSVRKIPALSTFNTSKNSTLDNFLSRSTGFVQSSATKSLSRGLTWANKPGTGSKSMRASAIKNNSKLSSLRAEHRSDQEQRAAVESIVRSQVKERVQSYREEHKSNTSVAADLRIAVDLQSARSGDLQLKAGGAAHLDQELENLVSDSGLDPLESALDNVKKQQSKVVLGPVPYLRRRVVCLESMGQQMKPVYGKLSASPMRPPPPKLDDWYRRILSMNYFTTIGISTEVDTSDKDSAEVMVKLPITFKSADHYLEVFRPLLLEEFKAQLQRAHEEISTSDGMTIGEVNLLSLERVDDFQLGRFIAVAGADGAARACSENDLIILTKQPFNGEGQSLHILAKVDKRDRDKVNKAAATLLLRLYINQGNSRLAKAKRMLVDRSRWHMTRLLSMTPQLREFQAISAIANSPWMPAILCSTLDKSRFTSKDTSGSGIHSPPPQLHHLKILPDELQAKLRSEYNDSQLSAISAAIGRKDDHVSHQLALVQGPPGTGKTRTIVAIVSALLALGSSSAKRNKYSSQMHDSTPSTKPTYRCKAQSAAVLQSWQDLQVAKDLMAQENSQTGVNKKQRVLVCAQSNAAVDEMVLRFCKYGLYGTDGQFYKPNLVRVGNAKTVHPDSNHVFIDTLVDQRLAQVCTGDAEDIGPDQAHVLRTRLEHLSERIQKFEAAKARQQQQQQQQQDVEDISDKAVIGPVMDLPEESTFEDGDGSPDQDDILLDTIKRQGVECIEIKLKSLYRQRNDFYAKLQEAQKRERKAFDESRAKREELRKNILRRADIVLTTLNGCGGDIYTTCMETLAGNKKTNQSDECFFNAVVIDEAAQALEPATLIPLQLLLHHQARCVLVGDPKQLPATVLSQAASKMAFECSMFERLQRAGYPVTLLSIQYRMHPEIREFPSEHFYDNKLIDGETVTEGRRTAAFHHHWCLGPYVFFDVADGQEKTRIGSVTQSLCNEAEADVALEVFRMLVQRHPNEKMSGRVGVITPYKQQLMVLRERFKRGLGHAVDIEFNTVDGFQGREVDILILSTVRASSGLSGKGGIGFVADVRRMNVALTRARYSLWIIGNAMTLQTSPQWASLLANARKRGVVYSLRRPYSALLSADTPPEGQKKAESGHFERYSRETASRQSEPVRKRVRSSQTETTTDIKEVVEKEKRIQRMAAPSKELSSSARPSGKSGGQVVREQVSNTTERLHFHPEKGPTVRPHEDGNQVSSAARSRLVGKRRGDEVQGTKPTMVSSGLEVGGSEPSNKRARCGEGESMDARVQKNVWRSSDSQKAVVKERVATPGTFPGGPGRNLVGSTGWRGAASEEVGVRRPERPCLDREKDSGGEIQLKESARRQSHGYDRSSSNYPRNHGGGGEAMNRSQARSSSRDNKQREQSVEGRVTDERRWDSETDRNRRWERRDVQNVARHQRPLEKGTEVMQVAPVAGGDDGVALRRKQRAEAGAMLPTGFLPSRRQPQSGRPAEASRNRPTSSRPDPMPRGNHGAHESKVSEA